jgi:hypothetical protein
MFQGHHLQDFQCVHESPDPAEHLLCIPQSDRLVCPCDLQEVVQVLGQCGFLGNHAVGPDPHLCQRVVGNFSVSKDIPLQYFAKDPVRLDGIVPKQLWAPLWAGPSLGPPLL